jgi:hypothetical protein
MTRDLESYSSRFSPPELVAQFLINSVNGYSANSGAFPLRRNGCLEKNKTETMFHAQRDSTFHKLNLTETVKKFYSREAVCVTRRGGYWRRKESTNKEELRKRRIVRYWESTLDIGTGPV